MKRDLGASWLPRVGWEKLGKEKMKHEKGFGCFMVPKRGVGRVRPKMKHEKGFGCFMAPKSGVGRVWEGAKWFRRVWWAHGSQEWGGKDGNFCGWRFRWSTKAIAAALDPTPFNET